MSLQNRIYSFFHALSRHFIFKCVSVLLSLYIISILVFIDIIFTKRKRIFDVYFFCMYLFSFQK